MRDSFEASRSRSPENNNKSLDSKRGIFTSLDNTRPNASPYLENSLEGRPANISHHETLIRSKEYLVPPQPTYTRANYHMGGFDGHKEVTSRVTPPPEVRFNYQSGNNSRGESPINYVPIQGNITTQSIHQAAHNEPIQIRKTYVPHHIYNHIPVNMGASLQEHSVQQVKTVTHSDEAYDVLLREYEKLYNRLERESQHCHELEESIKNQIHQPYHPEGEDRNIRYSLNVQVLHDRLRKYYEEYVEEIIKKRKASAHSRVRALFEKASEVSVTTVTEEYSF